MSERVAILGGGFNPVGLHHVALARRIVDSLDMSVWFLPCYHHRFAKDSDLADSSHRWNMLTMAIDGERIRACDWEIAHKHTGSMFETMEGLTQRYPTTSFHIAIGMDNANSIAKWDRYERLIHKFPFIIFPRPTVQWLVDWFTVPPHIILPFNQKTSSTKIRNAIQDGRFDFAQQHLDPHVWGYIQAGALYGYRLHSSGGTH